LVKSGKRTAQILVSGVIVALLAVVFDLGAAAETLGGFSVSAIAPIIALLALNIIIASIRLWRFLARSSVRRDYLARFPATVENPLSSRVKPCRSRVPDQPAVRRGRPVDRPVDRHPQAGCGRGDWGLCFIA
jgi:hypothetical protein